MLRITKEFIRSQKFESVGKIDDDEKYFRPRPGMFLPPSTDRQMITLRKHFTNIMLEMYKQSFARLEVRCGINESTMRKYLKGTRKITREAVAKICVGTPLSIDLSEELFTLQGNSLEPEKQLFDALIVNALQDGDDIEVFLDTCEKFGIEIF